MVATATAIRPLRLGELVTIYLRALPDAFHFTGFYAGRYWWEGRWFIDLAIDGHLMALQRDQIYQIERHETPAVTCGR